MIVDCYAGQVQYFFKHIVDFEDGPVEPVLVTRLDRSNRTVLDWTVQFSRLYSIGTGPNYTNFGQLEYFYFYYITKI